MDSKKRLLVFGVWTVGITLVALFIKFYVLPKQQQIVKEQQEQSKKEILEATSSAQRFNKYINVSFDGFAGYSILRSQEFKNLMGSFGIGLIFNNDSANYDARIAALDEGSSDIAVFPLDSFLTACNRIKATTPPATIVALCDETVGADAVLGYSKKYPNKIDSINSSKTKFVCVRNSPSEFITRVMRANFDLKEIPQDAFIECDSPEDVYKLWRNSKPDEDKVYILWEPYVTKILENPNMHKIVDSSRFRGYVVDVFVVNRDFMFKNSEMVKTFIECYFKALYENKNKMSALVKADAADFGLSISDKQTDTLVDGIWWKNLNENYAHMGVSKGYSLMHIEDVIHQINLVLKKTDPSYVDPTNGNYRIAYDNKLLSDMYGENFHPGQIGNDGEIRSEIKLKNLTDEEWALLKPVGTLQVPNISFARGTVSLTVNSKNVLDELAKNLQTWPTYYLQVQGSASNLGSNLDANKNKAKERAKVVVDYLIQNGIDSVRIRALEEVRMEGASVSFVLGQQDF